MEAVGALVAVVGTVWHVKFKASDDAHKCGLMLICTQLHQ